MTWQADRARATEFRARCSRLIDEVAETGREIVITKRRRPVAWLVPIRRRRVHFMVSVRTRLESTVSAGRRSTWTGGIRLTRSGFGAGKCGGSDVLACRVKESEGRFW